MVADVTVRARTDSVTEAGEVFERGVRVGRGVVGYGPFLPWGFEVVGVTTVDAE